MNVGDSEHSMTLLELFHALSSRGEFTVYTVERSNLEIAFLKGTRSQRRMLKEGGNGRGLGS